MEHEDVPVNGVALPLLDAAHDEVIVGRLGALDGVVSHAEVVFGVDVSQRGQGVQLYIGGEWIASLELEAAILTHPAVREAAVIAVPDERWGERPMACLLLVPGQSVTPAELREHLSGQGVVKWWLPDYWVFVDEVPRTSVGKYDKKLLRARNAEGSLHAETSD